MRIAAILFVILFAGQAEAAGRCGPHKTMQEQLRTQFTEELVGFALLNQGQSLVQLFRALDGSWTVLHTMPTGRACVVLAGNGWVKVNPNYLEDFDL